MRQERRTPMSSIRRSFSKKLSLSILLMAAPIFILSLGTLFIQSRHLVRQEVIDRSVNTLNTTMQRVRNHMSTIENAANSNAWLMEENFTPDTLQSVCHNIVDLNRNVLSCSVSAKPDVFPQQGHYFSVYTVNYGDTIVTFQESDYDYLNKVWYKTPMETGKAGWVDPFSEYTEAAIDHNDAVASYCRPLYRKNEKATGKGDKSQIIGVVATDMSFSQLAQSINAVQTPYPDAYFMLLGGDGRFFICPDTTQLFRKTIFTDTDPSQHADIIALGYEMTAGKQGTMHVRHNGMLYHVCYSPVPETNWSLALVCPDKNMLTNYRRLAYVIIPLIIIGLLLIIWFCQYVVRQTISPIHQLLNSSQKIAEGKYDEEIAFSDRKDAVGELQNSFAKMQQSLVNHMEGIRSTAKEISQRNEGLEQSMEQAVDVAKKKNLFIQHVLHQIRTPLNIILGFAEVLRDSFASQTLSKEELGNIITMMKHNAHHLSRMVVMLYDSSETGTADELQQLRNDEISCNTLAQECIDHTLAHFPDIHILFETDLPDNLHILTNRLYLIRTIRELLYNAGKYSDKQHIKFTLSQTETTVCFSIEDVGSGLPQAAQEVLFNPFTKVDEHTEGLGLGLALCKRHAASLGGSLLYDKGYTQGCRIILELPK